MMNQSPPSKPVSPCVPVCWFVWQASSYWASPAAFTNCWAIQLHFIEKEKGVCQNQTGCFRASEPPPYKPDDNIIHVLTTPSYTPSIMGIVYEDCYHYLLKLSPLLMKNLKRSKKLHQLFRKLHQLFQKLHQLFWKDQSVLTRAKRLLKTLSSEFSYWLNEWTEPRKKIDKTSFHISQISETTCS